MILSSACSERISRAYFFGLVDLLEQTLKSRGLTATIGSEIRDSRLNAFGVVAASYASGSMPLGSLAVLGPVRMD